MKYDFIQTALRDVYSSMSSDSGQVISENIKKLFDEINNAFTPIGSGYTSL